MLDTKGRVMGKGQKDAPSSMKPLSALQAPGQDALNELHRVCTANRLHCEIDTSDKPFPPQGLDRFLLNPLR